LAPEQYDSCACTAAGTQCLNKQQYIQAMQILAALCLNDAKSCYNHIVLLIMAICLCQLGAPISAMESLMATLAQLHHHVWSAYGNSIHLQGQNDWQDPVAGIGQGNGWAPDLGSCKYAIICNSPPRKVCSNGHLNCPYNIG